MKKYLSLLFILLSAGCFSAFGQTAKGDICFKDYNYRQAISYYQKALSSNADDTSALIHLAACYRILRDYDNAETYYAKAASMSHVSPMVYFYYGQVLKCNGKIDEAKQQFIKYAKARPSDSAAAKEVRYCDRLKTKFYIAYPVSTINNINSSHTEFCPVIYNDELIFISDRQSDIVNMSNNNSTGGNFFKVFEAKPTHDGYETPKEFPIQVNKTESRFNIGPVAFSADGNEIFFTEIASIRKNDFINQGKLFYCEKSGSGWGSPQPFPYNSDDYTVMDPCLSTDGKTLYFASNMPGGFGGNDIYMSQRTNGEWSKPQNLGSEVNTPGNEAFPYMRKDGVLFFASDRHFNYGGLDLFSATYSNGQWTNVNNLGPDINSSSDDFGVYFNADNRTGFFSSNRKGGKGLDDIYSFNFIGDYKPLKGSVLFSFNINDPVPGVGVSLLREDGTVITTIKTDNKGGFAFDKLEPDKKYLVKVDETDPRFAGKKKFYLADSTGKIVAFTDLGKNGKFVFTALPPDLTSMPKLDVTDKGINLAGNLLQGDSAKPLANIKLNLVNANGQVIQTATTNAFGAFVFTDLPPDENYEFKLAETADSKFTPRTKVILTDKHGNTIKTFFFGPDGKFSFQVLTADTSALSHMMVDDPQLRLQFSNVLLSSDQKTPLSNVKVSIVDKNGGTLQSTVTGPNGDFTFTNLPPDKNYTVQVDFGDSKLSKLTKIYLADSKKNILKEIDLANGGFKYEILPADEKAIGNVYVYDPWIEALNLKNKKNNKSDSMHIIENIYYDYQKWDILPAAARVLDKVAEVVKADPHIMIELDAYTDPRGAADFNMQLSQKRADAAVTYLITHGVPKARVTGKGLGKNHPINNCGDPNVHCSEEEFAVNRRTEFKLSRTGK